jgi:hypothetical protein
MRLPAVALAVGLAVGVAVGRAVRVTVTVTWNGSGEPVNSSDWIRKTEWLLPLDAC